MSGHDKPQKVDHGGNFTQWPRGLLVSPSWCALSMRAKCLLIALASRFNGRNNGTIAASARDLADAIGSHRYKANRAALGELIETGFVVPERVYPKGSRMATEYRLTWIESGHGAHRKAATNDWKAFEIGNGRKLFGDVSYTRNRKPVDGASTDRKRSVDAPSTGEVETPPFSVDAPSTHLVCHPTGARVVPFPSSEAPRNAAGDFRGTENPSCMMDLDELRAFTGNYLKWAGLGSQTTLAKSASIPGGSLSKFLAGRGLAAAHRLTLQLAVGKAWPLEQRKASA